MQKDKTTILNYFRSMFTGIMLGFLIGALEALYFRMTFYKNFPPSNSMATTLVLPGIIITTFLTGSIIGAIAGIISTKWKRISKLIFIVISTAILLWVIMVPFKSLLFLENIFSRMIG